MEVTKQHKLPIGEGVLVNTMIPNNDAHENQLQPLILWFLKEFQVGKILSQSNCRKERGVPVVEIFKTLFSLVFTGKTFLRFLQTDLESAAGTKDTVYRFLNSTCTNWRKFLWLLSSTVFKYIRSLTSEGRVDVLIVDDSLYSRFRSKKVELLAKVFDHVNHRFVKGFRMLSLGWSDGNSFVPLAFSLLSSQKEKNRLVEMNPGIDKRSNGYRRRIEATRKSTDVLIVLLQEAKEQGFIAKHVLFDSWFAFPNVLARVLGIGFHPIAMVKKSPKVFYRYQGKAITLESLYAAVNKKRGRAKILASVIVELNQTLSDQPIRAKIVFVRDRNRSRQWLALITTDIDLPDEEVVRLYGKRWDIEVFFKVIKTHLKLGKEFQGRSYDSMVAHTTIVFARYILLSLGQRKNNDDRTLGGIFFDCCDELQDIRFVTALGLLLSLMARLLSEVVNVTKEQVAELYSKFVAGLPSQFKVQLQLSKCES